MCICRSDRSYICYFNICFSVSCQLKKHIKDVVLFVGRFLLIGMFFFVYKKIKLKIEIPLETYIKYKTVYFKLLPLRSSEAF